MTTKEKLELLRKALEEIILYDSATTQAWIAEEVLEQCGYDLPTSSSEDADG